MIYRFADCSLDVDRQELWRGAYLVPAEPKVLDLLLFLIRNRERVVSKDDLITHVWQGRIVSESTLTSRLTAARQAIGDSGQEQRLIRTVPRKGVRFVAEVDQASGGPKQLRLSHPSAGAGEHALVLPNKPSIAVLAFQDMSGEPDQEHFADGIAEDITTSLSRSPSLFVISRNSSFSYKGRAADMRQIARELGVRYVLEGSVRHSGNRARITAQLVDALTGNHLWAERYDRGLTDIFAVQDEITEAIVVAIEPAVAGMERYRAVRKSPESLGAWEAYQRGLWHMGRVGVNDDEAAKSFFRQAIDLDPNFAAAHAQLAIAILRGAGLYHAKSTAEAIDEALPMAQRAVSLDPTGAAPCASIAFARLFQNDLEGMMGAARQALAISPNYAAAHHLLGMALLFSGHPREAIDAYRNAMRLDPHDPFAMIRLSQIATAHYFLREYGAAVEAAKEAIRAYPDHPWTYRWLAAALGQLDRFAEAKHALERQQTVALKSFDMHVRERVPWMRCEDYEHMVEGLRKAGWES